MFCLFHVCLPWMLWPCKTQPCKWACVYVSKASPTRICCHKPYFDCLLPFDSWRVSLPSAIIWSSEGECGSTVYYRLSCGTSNQKPHADVLLPPAFMLIHHSRVTGRGEKSLLLTVQDGWPAPHDDSLWMLPYVTKSHRGTNLCPFHL